MTPFNEMFHDLRHRAHMPLKTLSTLTGLSGKTLFKMERGVIPPPDTEDIVELCRVMGVCRDDIIRLVDAACGYKGTPPPDDMDTMSKYLRKEWERRVAGCSSGYYDYDLEERDMRVEYLEYLDMRHKHIFNALARCRAILDNINDTEEQSA
jgi:hypothetical protein